MTNAHAAGARSHGAVRAAVAAATLAVAACFGAAISFAQTPVQPAEPTTASAIR